MNPLKLVLLPSLKVKKVSNHQIIITQKFIDGVIEYQKYWSGSIVVFVEEDDALNNNLDNILINLNELPFKIEIINLESLRNRPELHENSIFLISTDFRQNQISKICKQHNIPCIYITEYSLNTRIQIINATTKNPILRLRRYAWEVSQELKQRKAIAIANGVQCNGVPTYQSYQKINPNPCLYFDTRIAEYF
ncbi:MAG TPA: hypothetical protein DCQ51_21860 [Planktothrix sp. UBA8407]|nr:hypothetical protein [Planktothrix sp. UBA8407]HBK21256.1 hypothetical protein [Planktothrix sp. UBA10369]